MTTYVNVIGDKWIFIDSNIDCNDYYLKDSVIRENNNIKVWVKRVYNQGNMIIDFLNPHINNDNYDHIHHSLLLYSIDYINYNYCIESRLHYNSDDVLIFNIETFPICNQIKSDSKVEYILKQIIQSL